MKNDINELIFDFVNYRYGAKKTIQNGNLWDKDHCDNEIRAEQRRALVHKINNDDPLEIINYIVSFGDGMIDFQSSVLDEFIYFIIDTSL